MIASGAEAQVGVIIVTYNSRRHYARQKAALEAIATPFALYVIDNASDLGQRPTARDFPAGTVILQMDANLGFAAANNQVAKLVTGPFVALLNPDAFPDPDWLEHLLAAAERWPAAGAFGSTQILADDESAYDGLGDCYAIAGLPWRGGHGWPRTTPQVEGEVFSPCAAAALYRMEAWRDASGFDERFFCYCEDVDLGFRLRLMGWTCVQAPRAVVRHIGGASSGPRSRFAIYYGTRNRLWTYVKNMPAPLLVLTAPVHALATMAMLAAALLRGNAGAAVRGIVAGVAGLPAIWRTRKRSTASWIRVAAAMSWAPWKWMSRAPVVKPIPGSALPNESSAR